MDAVDWLAIGLAVVFIVWQVWLWYRQRTADRAGLAEAERHRIAAARMRAADRSAWREVGEARSRRNPVEHPAPRREVPPSRKPELGPTRRRETRPSGDSTLGDWPHVPTFPVDKRGGTGPYCGEPSVGGGYDGGSFSTSDSSSSSSSSSCSGGD